MSMRSKRPYKDRPVTLGELRRIDRLLSSSVPPDGTAE
jgi:hypothetical protein